MDLKELGSQINPAQHWYYQSKLIPLRRWFDQLLEQAEKPVTLVDFGAGSGFFGRALLERGGTRVEKLMLVDAHYSDQDLDGQGQDGKIVLVRSLPDDLVGPVAIVLMDVLEHIEDDRGVLVTLRESLPPGAIYFISVPAFQCLWSDHDEFLDHHRRYTLPGLTRRLTASEWSTDRGYYIFAALLPLAWAWRMVNGWFAKSKAGESDMGNLPRPLDRCLLAWHRIEMALCGLNGIGGLTVIAEGRVGKPARPFRLKQSQQFIGFAAVGVIGTLVHFLILWLGVEQLGWSALQATVPGFICAALVNFLMNRRFVFMVPGHFLPGLLRFFIVAGIGLLLNTGLMALLLSQTSLHYLVAQAFTVIAVLAWNFLGNRHWTFAEDRGTKGTER